MKIKVNLFPKNKMVRKKRSGPQDAIPNRGWQNNLFVDIRADMVNIFTI
jgi:hypothetical protein